MKYSGSPTQDFLNGKQKKVTINLNDSKSIDKALKETNSIGEELYKAIEERIEELCQLGEDTAKANVHVDSGALKASITHKVKRTKKKITGTITAGTDHAMFQEYGTGIRGKGTYEGDSSGWVYDYKNQGWAGHPATNFMYRAAREMEKEMNK